MDYAIHTLLSRTSHAMQNYLRPHLGKLGLSPGQPKVLRCLNAMEPCSQRMLADYCEVDPAAICRMLDSLERDGFLERRPSKTDRRAGEVVLTEKGREAFAISHQVFFDWDEKRLADLDFLLHEIKSRLQGA